MLVPWSVCVLLIVPLGCKAQWIDNFPDRKEFLVSAKAKDDLNKMDRELINNLITYASKLEEKAERIQRIVREIRQPLKAAKGIEEEYLSNPLHSFPLIRHLYEDWQHLEEFMQQPVGEEEIKFLKRKLQDAPWQADVLEATDAIYRIALVYGVNPEDMANGLVEGLQMNSTLSALDCFAIAKLFFQRGHYKEAADWLTNTVNRMTDEYSEVHEVLGLTLKDVALLLARSLVEMGYPDKAREVLVGQPDLAGKANDFLEAYQAYPHNIREPVPKLEDNFKTACRSSTPPKPSRLFCRYNTTASAFLKIAPLKTEEISLDPYIVAYHDVVPPKDIERVIRWGERKIKPTFVFHQSAGQRNLGRTSLGVWSPGNDSKDREARTLFDRYAQRIRDITGLRVQNGHYFQLLKYGFGGHYSPHHDYFNMSTPFIKVKGDRMATVLFYLNDAPHGGATVFPYLGIKVPAEKGKVLFWYNIKGDTHEVDPRTVHGACPVFHRAKWALTAWIPELDQMFIKPAVRPGNRTFYFD